MNILGFIPARAGSQGIKHKNKKLLLNKPLISYSIEASLASQLDTTIVSSDDEEIIQIAKNYNLDTNYKRSKSISKNETSMLDTLLDFLHWYEKYYALPDAICILQPTSPLRIAADINAAIDLLKTKQKAVIAINTMSEHPNDCIQLFKDSTYNYLNEDLQTTRRQDYEQNFYYINGALYILKTNFILTNKKLFDRNDLVFYKMPKSRSIDIDEILDFIIAENILKTLS